jgi:nicotinate-nucleotide pyrophosphorylase (carboxylating)
LNLDAASRQLITMALAEDFGSVGDITTQHFLPVGELFRARLIFKDPGLLCGRTVFDAVCRKVSPRIKVTWKVREGSRLRRGQCAAEIRGPRQLLSAERTALNFLQQLSGIATLTSAYVKQARGTGTRILDTRKTLPGWRTLSKYAVRVGGGCNHRMGLFDMAMLKDNHLAPLTAEQATARISSFRRRYPKTPVEIEAANAREVDLALRLGADFILLDNMTPTQLKREIRRIRAHGKRSPQIEISGGVDLKSVGRLAKLGADRISIGRITHSAPAHDISLQLSR